MRAAQRLILAVSRQMSEHVMMMATLTLMLMLMSESLSLEHRLQRERVHDGGVDLTSFDEHCLVDELVVLVQHDGAPAHGREADGAHAHRAQEAAVRRRRKHERRHRHSAGAALHDAGEEAPPRVLSVVDGGDGVALQRLADEASSQ